MARIVGKDALPARQRLLLGCAELVNDAFLRQSAFSPMDRVCTPQRQACMLRLLAHFIELAEAAVGRGATPEAVFALDVLRPLARMGEEIADAHTAAELPAMLTRFAELQQRVEAAFETWAPRAQAAPITSTTEAA
jgi:V/A-type H+-transporting ATPase subunit A